MLAKVAEITAAVDLAARPNDVLFSLRRFKQRGARYCRPETKTEAETETEAEAEANTEAATPALQQGAA